MEEDDSQQFFGIMKKSQNVLICCQAFQYVGYMRYNAIQKLHRVLKSQTGVVYFPLTDVSNLLGCDNVETAANVCVEFGLTVQVQEGTGTQCVLFKRENRPVQPDTIKKGLTKFWLTKSVAQK